MRVRLEIGIALAFVILCSSLVVARPGALAVPAVRPVAAAHAWATSLAERCLEVVVDASC